MNNQFVFFVDVDNTLINNDLIKKEIHHALVAVLGEKEAESFWHHHDAFRAETDVVHFPKIIERYCKSQQKNDCEVLLYKLFNDMRFSHALYAASFAVLTHLKTLGKVVLFTQGDSYYQKMKVKKSGLQEKVEEVYLFDRKFKEAPRLIQEYKPATVVFIDDRGDELIALKKKMPHVFVIQVLQGHYAGIELPEDDYIDMKVTSIEQLLEFSKDDLR